MMQVYLVDEISLDLARACVELGQARLRLSEKDTPAHRAAVAECRAAIDSFLDMYLASGAMGVLDV